MARGWPHSTDRGDRTINEREGGRPGDSSYVTMLEAVRREMARAKRTEVVTGNLNGKIAERNIDGDVPRRLPD